MNVTRHILAIARKDLQVLFKDRGELVVLFLMPLLFAFLFGAPGKFAESIDEPGAEPALVIKTYLSNQDTGPYGAQVAAVLAGITMLDLQEVDSADAADQQVADGNAAAGIIIPANFSARIDGSQPVKVRLIKDPTQQALASIVAGVLNNAMAELSVRAEIEYGIRAVWAQTDAFDQADPAFVRAAQAQTMGVIWTQVQDFRRNPVIAVEQENLSGEATAEEAFNPFVYLMPMFATMFAFFLVGTMAESILKEKEGGSFRRLLAAPLHRGSIISGKMVAYIIVVFLQMAVMFTVGAAFFEMPLGDSPLGLGLLTLAVALAATSLGMLVGAIARSTKQAGNIGLLLGFVLWGASGSMLSSADISDIGFRSQGFQYYLSCVTPHAHALDGYLKLMAEGAGWADLLPNVAALLAFALVFFGVAMWQFKFE